MDTHQTLVFFGKKEEAPEGVDLDGFGCPECGSAEFTRVENLVEYATQRACGSWKSNGVPEIHDYDDYETHDSDHRGMERYECVDCYHEYDDDEAELAENYVGEGSEDEDDSCLTVCGDMECDGSCRTDAAWPFLGDNGVVRHDALGVQLETLAPGTDSFALDERLGFTVVLAVPKLKPGRRDYREGSADIPCCTICKGDMTTPYERSTHLTFKQERYSPSQGTREVTMQFQQSICYVCHTG